MQDRYKRNIMLEEIGSEGQKKLLNSSVLIIGAGGLGSSVIANLAAVGVGNIGIVDFDKVDESNLNRQFIHKTSSIGMLKTQSVEQWVKEFNPDVKVTTYTLILDKKNAEEIIKDYDVIIDCVDNFGAKFLINKLCVQMDKKLVHGGVEEFSGQIFNVLGKESACLACLFETFEHNYTKGIISPVVSVIGSLQSAQAVKLLLDIDNPLVNTILKYDFLDERFKKISIEKNPDCPICSKH